MHANLSHPAYGSFVLRLMFMSGQLVCKGLVAAIDRIGAMFTIVAKKKVVIAIAHLPPPGDSDVRDIRPALVQDWHRGGCGDGFLQGVGDRAAPPGAATS